MKRVPKSSIRHDKIRTWRFERADANKICEVPRRRLRTSEACMGLNAPDVSPGLFTVGWINSLDGMALDDRDVKRRAWRRALLPAPIKNRLRLASFSAPQAQDSRLI
jgi:hypothetical protein